MDEEQKKENASQTSEGANENSSNRISVIEEARKERMELERIRQEVKAEREALERIRVQEEFAGNAPAGNEEQEEKRPETNSEYRKRIEEEIRAGKYD